MIRRILLTAALATAIAGIAWAATQPLASAASNVDGLEIDLMSVERKGNVLTVKWAVRNTGEEERRALFSLLGNGSSTYVVDEENGAKYYALTDQDGQLLASMHEYTESSRYGIREDMAPGTTKRFWAKFPAPPPEVKEVSVFFTETEPLEGIAITDK